MKSFFTALEIDRIKKSIENRIISQQEIIWTTGDIAKHFGWSLKTVHNMISKRKLPFHRVSGKTVLFLKSEIIDFIKNYNENGVEEK